MAVDEDRADPTVAWIKVFPRVLAETALGQHAQKALAAHAIGMLGFQTRARNLQRQSAIKFAHSDDGALFISSFRENP
eukprot:5844428-Alexandrium_andersonii.AAC.1